MGHRMSMGHVYFGGTTYVVSIGNQMAIEKSKKNTTQEPPKRGKGAIEPQQREQKGAARCCTVQSEDVMFDPLPWLLFCVVSCLPPQRSDRGNKSTLRAEISNTKRSTFDEIMARRRVRMWW